MIDGEQKRYMSQSDTEVYIESLGQDKVVVNNKGKLLTIKDYIDKSIKAAIQEANGYSDDIIITEAKIANGSVTNPKLDTTAGEPGGVWKTWTPVFTLNNAASQNATCTGAYTKIGKTVHYWAQFVVIPTSNFGGMNFIDLTAPVTPSSTLNGNVYTPAGQAMFLSSGVWVNQGNVFHVGGNKFRVHCTTVAVSSTTHTGQSYSSDITGTVPFTWKANDRIHVFGTYEAA
jgi:hypothetical protein